MKWIFLFGLLCLVPIATAILKSSPRYLLHACFLMGLLPFFLDPYLYVAPISWPAWPGVIKGIEVSVIDAIAVAMLLATRPVRTPARLKLGFAVVVTAIVISTIAAQQTNPSVWYAWQLLRAVIVFLAVARATATVGEAPIALAAGLGSAVVIQAFLAGGSSAGGNLGHQNLLGLSSHFAVLPAFALLLAGRRTLPAALVVISGIVIALVGGSRATIGLLGIGLIVTTILSIRHKSTGRKLGFAVALVVMIAAAAPVMMWSIERRSEAALKSSDYERKSMTEAARMIIADNPLGVGANQYVIVANIGGYSDRAGVAWNQTSRAAPVHNSYYLVAAELGFVGLIGLVVTLLSMIALGLRAMRRLVPSERSELFIGLLATLIVVSAHLAFEYLLMTFIIHYLLAMNMGALVGIAASHAQRTKQEKAGSAARSAQRLATQPA